MNRKIFPLLLALPLSAGASRADVVHFGNPAPAEPGHYAWHAAFSGEVYLDITLSPLNQTNAANGSSIGQGLGGFPGGPPSFGVLVGGASFAVTAIDEPWVLGLEHGQPLSGRPYTSWGGFGEGLPQEGPQFPEGEPRYIGVLTSGGHYGWIEVELSGLNLTARSWAYETVPNVPIGAGQVPAPGAAAVPGAGVIAMSTRRRRS